MNADPFVNAAHVCGALAVSNGTLNKLLREGKIPAPDRRGQGNAKLWKISTIRAWSPQAAMRIESLLSIPAIRNAA